MRDLVFTGADVAEALASASRALDLPAERLRHVVLDAGRPERLGVKGQPARVAVLLEGSRALTEERASRTTMSSSAVAPEPAALVTALAQAANLELEAEQEDAIDDARVLRLRGAGARVLLEQPELFEALEHLLQKAGQKPGQPRLRVECEGYREWREARLRAQVLELATAVREDGRPRRTPPLNSYERRLVHIAVSELPGLETHSEGEGGSRHVVISAAGTSTPSGDDTAA